MRYGQQNSAVFNHISEEGHVMNWSAAYIVFGSACRYRSQVVEVALFHQQTSTITKELSSRMSWMIFCLTPKEAQAQNPEINRQYLTLEW